MKQAIIIRTDLKMGKGKLAAQAAHASLGAYKKAGFFAKKKWETSGQKKVVLKVNSEKEMKELYRKALSKKGFNPELIRDAGKTQIPEGSMTALAFGPCEDDKIDSITSNLKLL